MRIQNLLSGSHHKGSFDIIVLDPPSLAPSQKSLPRATRAFRWMVAQACRLLKPGGLLVLSCCSAAVDLDTLARTLAIGAKDTGSSATILERWFQGADHPVPAAFSEGLYLKSFLARIEPN